VDNEREVRTRQCIVHFVETMNHGLSTLVKRRMVYDGGASA